MLVETPVHAHGRRRVLPSRAAVRELVIFVAAYLTYFGVRAITEGEPWRAFQNAMTLHRLEVDLGLAWEGAVQDAVLGSQVLVDVTNAVYIYGHWPVLIGAGVLLFRHRRAHYYRLRNVCLLTGLVGLVIFTLLPVAPPRLTDLPVIDTVTRDSEGYRLLLPPSLVNEYAAMPSFHAGWNLLVGVIAFGASRHWAVRTFAILMPMSMAFAVVVGHAGVGPRVTVCSQERLSGEPGIRLVHSIGNARALRCLHTRFAGERLAGISIHRRLLDAATVGDLRSRADLVLSWPVETVAVARELAGYGVDGLISQAFEPIAAALGARETAVA